MKNISSVENNMIKLKPSFIFFIMLSTLSFTTYADKSSQLQGDADAIELQDSYVRPD